METTGRPLLTVVVPVHGVEPYLRECLDSVLIEAGPAVEVVAVDDASPDGCPAILDVYARANPAVRVVHLAANVGLGGARNAGLDRATGEYVWFVDADDWLPPGSVPAVLAALRAAARAGPRPDVLLLDHVRVHPDGRRAYDASSPLLRGVTDVGPLSRRPELLGLQHAAWNKVARTAYLRRLGLRFPPGWYEDVPFSHPLLIGAGAIAVLDRVCYAYRQRPTGITHTVSDRHLEALDQYERLFAALDEPAWAERSAVGRAEHPYRAALCRLMVHHGLVIVGNEKRVPADRRAEFFHRLARLHRRYRPAGGCRIPIGVAGLKHRLLAADAYPAYAALRSAHRLLGRRGRATGGPYATPYATPFATPAPAVATPSPAAHAGPGRHGPPRQADDAHHRSTATVGDRVAIGPPNRTAR